jgi:predicted nucleotidyltransferase
MFGSRAKGNYKNGSDVDIALKGKLSFETITHINYLLNEETTMPYKFDVLNYHTIQDKDLIEHINRAGICFYQYSNMLQH